MGKQTYGSDKTQNPIVDMKFLLPLKFGSMATLFYNDFKNTRAIH
jgi:hypothetical protein